MRGAPHNGHSHEAVNGAVHPSKQYELMSEKEVLDFKPALRLEQVGEERPKQVENPEHRAR
jgi:hypothetical protein